jgi:hypothetical protein
MALARTDVSEEISASFIRVKRIGELEPHGVTSQKTLFFIVTAMKTSSPTTIIQFLSYTGLR